MPRISHMRSPFWLRQPGGFIEFSPKLSTGPYRSMASVWNCNGILQDEFLFILPDDLTQARLLVDQVVKLYNEDHPHQPP